MIHAKPLRVDISRGSKLIISLNARGLLKYEHYRTKPQEAPPAAEEAAEEEEQVPAEQQAEDPQEVPQEEEPEEDQDGLWEESFKGHTDSKPRGPSSIGMDISFLNSKHVYGIPEHADSFSLKDTESGDPYRLYNLDVFEYELDNPMALYASIPVMLSHSTEGTTAVFWHNAAETWVDVKVCAALLSVSPLCVFFFYYPYFIEFWLPESIFLKKKLHAQKVISGFVFLNK